MESSLHNKSSLAVSIWHTKSSNDTSSVPGKEVPVGEKNEFVPLQVEQEADTSLLELLLYYQVYRK